MAMRWGLPPVLELTTSGAVVVRRGAKVRIGAGDGSELWRCAEGRWPVLELATSGAVAVRQGAMVRMGAGYEQGCGGAPMGKECVLVW